MTTEVGLERKRKRTIRALRLGGVLGLSILLIEMALKLLQSFVHLGGWEALLDGGLLALLVSPILYLLLLRPLTEEIARREDIEQDLGRFRLGMERSGEAVFMTAIDGTIIYANPAFEELYGFKCDDWQGKTPRILKSGVTSHEVYEHLWASMGAKPLVTGELINKTKDGRLLTIHSSSNPILDEDGRLLGFLAIQRDITEYRRAEEELRESEERHRAMFEANPHPMFVFDEETLEFVSVNDAAIAHYGYSRDEFLSMTIGDIRPVEDMPHLWDALAVAKKRPGVDLTEARHRKRDGTLMDVEITSHLLDVGGRPARFVLSYDISERKRAEAALRVQARTDELTKLPNRRAFDEEVEVSLAEPSARIALLILDFDRFKDINDSLGHPAGDQLLGMIAARLTGALRSGDTLARLGGDEFAVLVRGGARAESEAVASRLHGALKQPFRLKGMLLPVSASIGIAIAPDHGSRPQELLARADIAMYRAKRLHTRVEVFDPGEGDFSRDRLEFQAAFHAALEREELVLHYQPKIGLGNGRVVGVEALIRWNRPGYGLVPPDRFLPLAQETGMMSRITSYVLRQAVRDCRTWRDLGHDVSVSVNVPAASLVDGDLPGTVLSLIESEGLSPECLVVEVTENTFMDAHARSVEALERLRAAGVRISIDDYGTGFTSLAYLRDLPIDELKLDRTFIADLLQSPVHEAIVSSTIQLAHLLGLEVVAEGIEDAAVLDRLREIGCDLGQGYHILHPVPVKQLLAYLEGSRSLTAIPGPSRSGRAKKPPAEPARLGLVRADQRSGARLGEGAVVASVLPLLPTSLPLAWSWRSDREP